MSIRRFHKYNLRSNPEKLLILTGKEEEMKRILLAIMLLCPILLAVYPENSWAVPAFARKYKTSCVLCHAPFPRLTAMGEAFRLAGYRIPEGNELYVKEEPVSMGAEPYKKMFPEAIWPSTIPGIPPISVHVMGDVTQHLQGGKNTDFHLPSDAHLIGAGTFGTDFSFWAEFEFEKIDEGTETDAEAWLMWENLFSNVLGEHHLAIKGGNVGNREIALPNTVNDNRISFQEYLYATALNLDVEPGFEANGYGARWRYYAGVVQTDTTNNKKGVYGGFSVKFGGLGYDGSGGTLEAGGLGTTPSGYWRDDSLRLGFFAYRTYEGDHADTFDRIGGDARWTYKDIDISGGYIRGENDESNVDENIWFAGGQYCVYPWVVPYLRYEYLSSTGSDNTLDQGRFVVGCTALIRANIKFTAEGVFYTKNEPRDAGLSDAEDDMLIFQLSWAF
jgi:hypothetical protein